MRMPASFELLPMEREEIPRISYIHVVACLPDNAFGLFFATSKEFEDRVSEMLINQVGDPTWKHIKAVDRETGSIAAWASWNTPTDDQIRERDAKSVAGSPASGKDKTKGGFDYPPGLPLYVAEDTEKWLARWTQGRRYMVCKALFTDPSFQQHGMGTALLKYGNQLADQSTLPIYLQASPFGFPLYSKHGFETIRHLDVDLRVWAPKASGNDKGYGNYRFRYMLRLPKTVK